ncbi:AAA family ATPase [Shewanella surugensis]|uniref:ATP-binding protein n=1 Tax=Shewanella surugensis TaxID=212020 RepID=A0ABT0LF37_9GAMM|nr:ATP-binding protein [Shewanella surugensis]MCL1126275.1 ATP-binding protein [Shewanella surugensis]
MGKWRINKLKIIGFKIFSEFEESYSHNLIVYDGPNGFGKTSLFDAKQVLFCNNLPRVAARVGVLNVSGKKKFSKSLYQHHDSVGDVSIIVELKRGSESLFIMRLAKAKDLKKGNNKPTSFDNFKLYELTSFDNLVDVNLIADEQAFWSEKLGDKFLSNFTVLNYLQQDSKSIIIPDRCGGNKSRTNQIEHLINLDALKQRIENIVNFKSAAKKQLVSANEYFKNEKQALEELKNAILVEDIGNVAYERLTCTTTVPQELLSNVVYQ